MTVPIATAPGARCILEVLDSHGARVTLARLSTFPATIGRSPACDVVVDDPFLDGTHIRVVQEGELLVAEDAGSVNGLRANEASERAARVPLVRGTVLRAGRTTIRFLDPSEPVAPARRDRAAAWKAPLSGPARLRSRSARAGAVLLLLAIVAGNELLTHFDKDIAANLTAAIFVTIVVAAAWAGAWTLGARLARHPAHFTYHFAITCLAAAVLVITYEASQWLSFLWPGGPEGALLPLLFFAVIIVGIHAHLGLTSALRGVKRWGVAAAGPLLLIGIVWLVSLEKQSDFSSEMSFPSQLRPMPTRYVPTVTVAAFVREVARKRASVDKTEPK